MPFANPRALPLRYAGTMAVLLLAVPRHAAQASSTSPAPAGAEDGATDWARFKMLWQALDAGSVTQSHPAVELAGCFGLKDYELEDALRWTELEAAGTPAQMKTLAPARFALATLALTRLHLKPGSSPPPVAMTRMIALSPELQEHLRFQSMEQITDRIEELRKQLQTQDAELVLIGLSGIRMDVYHYRALRMAVDLHRGLHPMGGEVCRPGQPEAEAEARSLAGFLVDPSRSQIGTDAWLDQYQKALQNLQKDLKKPLAAKLQQQEAILAEALKRLDAARPRLEILFTDLENRSAAH